MRINGNLILNTDGSGTIQQLFVEKGAYGVGGSSLPSMTGLPGGRVVFNTSDDFLYFWNGTSWNSLAAGTTSVSTFQTSLAGLSPSSPTSGAVTLSGTLGATSGGTGFGSFTTGDILYASSTTALSKLAIGGANTVLHGGSTPSYSSVSLTADVSGVLPGGNGGTGVNNGANTITAGGNVNFGGAFTTTPANSVTFTTTGTTNVTLPTTGTLVTTTTAVTTATGTANQINVNGDTSAHSGAVTLTLSSTLVAPGSATVTTDLTVHGLTYESAAADVPAAGTDQGSATQLTKSYNSVTTSGTGQGVILPTAAPGLEITIVNETAGDTVNVYPASGDQIDAAGVNNPILLPAGGTVTFQSVNSDQWYTIDPVTVSGNGGISVTYGNGQTLISNTGVLSLSGGTTGLTVSSSTGAVTLTGTLNVANGGTGATTLTSHGVLYGNGTSAVGVTAAGTTGQVLVATTGSAPSFQPLSSVSIVSVSGTANQITASTVSGAVTLSIPSTFIAPGSVEVTTTLTVDTNTAKSFVYSDASKNVVTTAAPTNGQLLIGSTGNVPVAAALTAGTGISVTNGAGSITVANTGVTSLTSGTTSNSLTVTTNAAATGAVTVTANLNTLLDNVGQLAGNGIIAQTGANTVANRTITGTAGDISVSNGDGVSGNPTIDLISVGTPVSASFVKVTTDAKGRVTATTPVVTADITALVDATYVNVTGDSMSGNLTFTSGATVTGLPTPVAGTDAANKNYVDAAVAGLEWKNPAQALAVANTPLTGGATLTVDGYSVQNGDRVLLTGQTSSVDNGIYVASGIGTAYVLTRSTDMATGSNADNATLFIIHGTTYAETGWTQTQDPAVVGTNGLTFVQFTGAGTYVAGSGLTLTGNTFAVNYGAGITANPSNKVGVNLYTGNTSIAGALITTSNGTAFDDTSAGKLYLLLKASNPGLTQDSNGLYVGANQILNSMLLNSTVTLDVTSGGATDVALGGTLSIVGDTAQGVSTISSGTPGSAPTVTVTVADADTAGTKGVSTFDAAYFTATAGLISFNPAADLTVNSLTDSTLTTNSFLFSGTSGLLTTTAAPTNGQLLIGSTGAAPVKAALTAGTGVSVTNGAGSITIANTGVLSFSAGTTGLTPNTTTTGAVTLGGTLALANGGTNASLTAVAGAVVYSGGSALALTAAGTTGQVLTSNGTGTPTWASVSSLGVTSVTGTANEITASTVSGAVTLSIPSTFIAPGSVQVTTYLYESVSPAVTAAGTDQSTATPLTSMFNTVTTVGSGTGVVLPTAVAGLEISIVNFGSNSLFVYPAGSAQIDSGSASAPIVIPNGGTWTGQADSSTQWYSIDPVTIPGSGISVAYGNGQTVIGNTGVLSFSTGTTGLNVNASTGSLTLSGTLNVANGGTGATTLTAHGVLIGEGTGAVVATAVGATGTVLRGNTGADPSFGAVTLTTDVTGILPSANGGTGVDNSTAAVGTVLAATSTGHFTGKQMQYWATGAFTAATPATITHNLGQQNVLVQVYDTTGTPSQIIPDSIVLTNANSIAVTLNQSLASALVVVIGLAGASNGTF